MRSVARLLFVVSIVSVLAVWGGCGKKADEGESAQQKTAVETDDLQELPAGTVPFAQELADAGYEPVFYEYFPAALAGRNGKIIMYRSAGGGRDGGMIYVETYGDVADWVWHWYFEDASPRSARNAEVNRDGMWDVRVKMADGEGMELIQDDTFTLVGGRRGDKIALNGTCSQPLEGHPLWRCFDGDGVTTWASSLEGSSKPFIEVASPMGLADGILAITASSQHQPKDCVILASGKKVQSFKLKETTDEQLIHLDSELRTAKKIRLVFKSCHGDGSEVAIAEMEIR